MKNKFDFFLFYLANIILIFFRHTDGATGMGLVAILIGVFFRFYQKNLTYAFLLTIIVLSSPGRMFSGTPFGIDIHFLYFRDIFFYLSFLCFFSPKIKGIRFDGNIRRLLPFLIAFSFYQIVISIVFKLHIDNFFMLFKLLEQFKVQVFGVFVMLPCYKIIQLDFKLFIKTLVSLATIYALVFLVSVYTEFEIVHFATESRLSGGDVIRILIQNAEIFKLTLYIAIAAYFVTRGKENWKIYLAGIVTFAIPVVGMYRLELMYTIMTIFLLSFFLFKYLNAQFKKVLDLGLFMILVLFLLVQLVPSLWEGLSGAFVATAKEFMGEAPAGATQSRTIIELPTHLFLIKSSPVVGVGFRPEWWQNYLNHLDWGLSDIPFTSTLAMYGVVGMLIYYSRFYRIIKDSFNFYRATKLFDLRLIAKDHTIELITIFALGAYFVSMISFRFFYVGWELTLAYLQPQLGVFLGLFYGLISLIDKQLRILSSETEGQTN